MQKKSGCVKILFNQCKSHANKTKSVIKINKRQKQMSWFADYLITIF
ncbi:hypothetical protein [Moraxella lacunata]